MNKTKYLRLFIVMLSICFCMIFSGCENPEWKAVWANIAETTIAETSKADANFKIESSDTGVFDGLSIFVIDANKAEARYLPPRTIYMSKEKDDFYRYEKADGEKWQKTLFDTDFSTIGEYYFWRSDLRILDQALNDLDNVKYKGDRKYTYRHAYITGGGVNVVNNYTFITDGERVTEIQLDTRVTKITYGGQALVLPNIT